jgi:hypothetical protein
MSPDAFGNLMIILGAVLGVIFLIFFAASLVWVYADSQQRGKTGCLWLLIVFFTWPLGVIVYLILRDQNVQL